MRASILTVLLLLACDDKEGGADSADADADADVDTDADLDADVDADTDTDSDTQYEFSPVVVTSLTGTVDFATVLDGVPRCDLGIALTLDPDAEDPSFGYWSAGVLASVVRNDGDSACEAEALVYQDMMFSLFDPSGEHAMGLAYNPQAYDSAHDLYSYAIDGEGLDAEPIAHGDRYKKDYSPGELEVNENWPPDELRWESAVTVQVPEGPNLWYDACGSAVPASDTDQQVGTTVDDYQHLYGTNTLDVWTLVLTEADTVSLRVGSEYSASSEPLLWINDADGCTLIEAKANVPCDDEDAALACPALVIGLDPGMYEVVVAAAQPWGLDYELWSDLTFGLMELTGDDVKATAERTYEITASGDVSVTWEYE